MLKYLQFIVTRKPLLIGGGILISVFAIAATLLSLTPGAAHSTVASPQSTTALGFETTATRAATPAPSSATTTPTPTTAVVASQPQTPATPRKAITPAPTIPLYRPLTPTPSPTEPYTCYTYNWNDWNGSTWWIAYRYDVTPHPDGTNDIVYGGGGGNVGIPLPSPLPNMCAYNQPPNYPAPTTSPWPIGPDLSPH